MGINLEPQYPSAKSPNSFRDGMEYQDFVCTTLAQHGIILQNLMSKKYQFEVGENLQGFEIKLDDRCTDTERLSIEIAEKPFDAGYLEFRDSGIYRSDNSWLYIQGNYQIIFVFAKNWLIRWHKQKKPKVTEKRGTIRTFYLPFSVAIDCAARVFDFRE